MLPSSFRNRSNQNQDIDSEQYTRPMDTGSFMGSHWNTREIVHLFDYFENFIENSDKNKQFLLDSLGWTLEDWLWLGILSVLKVEKSYYHLRNFSNFLSRYKEYNWNIEWTEKLVRNHHKDSEIPVLSHNDAHAGNMMMNKTDFTAESLILIDWDITHYGYRDLFLTSSSVLVQQINRFFSVVKTRRRAFDLAYFMFWASMVQNYPGTDWMKKQLSKTNLIYIDFITK